MLLLDQNLAGTLIIIIIKYYNRIRKALNPRSKNNCFGHADLYIEISLAFLLELTN